MDGATAGGAPADTDAGDDARTSDAADSSLDADAEADAAAQGQPCSLAADCATGFCVDAVCCNTACESPCSSCTRRMSIGTCTAIPAGEGPRAASDCAAEDESTCGRDGTCDGLGSCRLRPSRTICSPGACAGDVMTGIGTCDGTGRCTPGPTLVCFPYRCDAAGRGCAASCATASDCAGAFNCVGGSCRTKEESGCASNDECASGHCAQGVCCNVACVGACRACNLAGTTGSCTLIGAGVPHSSCAAELPSTCGTTGRCDGAGACVRYADGTACGDAMTCQAGACLPPSDRGAPDAASPDG